MAQFTATGQWAIYSVQKDLPVSGLFGSAFGGVHNYLVLVDPSGNNIQEMQGVYQNEFTLGETVNGNYLRVQMWQPNQYMSDQSILSQNLVSSGTQSDMTTAFNNAFNTVATALDSTHDLYEGASLISGSNTYNSNSVWYTAMKALGVSDPSSYEGSHSGPGDTLNLTTAPTNNTNFGDPTNDPWAANPSNSVLYYYNNNQNGTSGQSGSIQDPDNGYNIAEDDEGNQYVWSTQLMSYNSTDTETSNTINFDGGYSQQQLFTGLPSGVSVRPRPPVQTPWICYTFLIEQASGRSESVHSLKNGHGDDRAIGRIARCGSE